MQTRLIIAYGLIAAMILFFAVLGFILARRRRAQQALWSRKRR